MARHVKAARSSEVGDAGAIRPIAYMLCGFVGSGKTTYSRRLEAAGARRLSIDEWVFEQYGRHGIDYPEHHYPMLEAAALEWLDAELVDFLAHRQSVVLDYGFWSRAQRDCYKEVIVRAGGSWRLLYLHADLDVIRERVLVRNRRTDANALNISEVQLKEFLTRWHPPANEGEELIRT